MTDEARAPDPWPLFTRTGTPEELNAMEANIEAVADRLIAVMVEAEENVVQTGGNGLKPEDVRFLAYALTVRRSRLGQVLTEDHLRLLAAALGVKRVSSGASRAVGLPPVKDLRLFIAAADMQGEEPDISENRLASAIGVDRRTIRDWRKMPEFHRRIRAVRFLAGERTERDKEMAALWAKARRDTWE